jgi:hypothetical protein
VLRIVNSSVYSIESNSGVSHYRFGGAAGE